KSWCFSQTLTPVAGGERIAHFVPSNRSHLPTSANDARLQKRYWRLLAHVWLLKSGRLGGLALRCSAALSEL
ncbi:TPA: hypothetical protein ACGJWY_006631, partial [Pseudomonas aeruginosa]